jgi:hypothetical protein
LSKYGLVIISLQRVGSILLRAAVRILKPSIHDDEYVNRKMFASLNVQATCNEEIFTSIDASWPGSVHDSRIWRNSEIREQFSRRYNNAVLLGDSGYGLEPWGPLHNI